MISSLPALKSIPQKRVGRTNRRATKDRVDWPDSVDLMTDALLRTAVIIPARNEAQSLPLVLHDLPRVGKIIVANNGSTDGTDTVAREHHCLVADEPTPGYGRACLAAMEQLDSLSNIDYVAFLDGDYSDHPEMLNQLLIPMLQDNYDFVLGSRLLGKRETGAMPAQAIWGNRLACFLMRIIWKARYTDLGPFRIIKRECLEHLHMQDQNFGWTVEMQIKATVANLKTIEVPVPYRRRIGVSKISGTVSGTMRAGYKILYTIAKYAWKNRWNKTAGD